MKYLLIIFIALSCKPYKEKTFYEFSGESSMNESQRVNSTKAHCLSDFSRDSAINLSKKIGVFITIDSVKNVSLKEIEVHLTINNKTGKIIKDMNISVAYHTSGNLFYHEVFNVKDLLVDNFINSFSFKKDEYLRGDSLNHAFPVDIAFENEKFELISYDSLIKCKL